MFFFILIVIATASLWVAPEVYAASLEEFVPLVPDLPQIGDTTDMVAYLNGLMALAVGAAALLAVIMIAIGGIQWMTTDSVPGIGNAKERIQDAIIGLIIVLTSVLLLNIINKDIVNLDIFRAADPVVIPGQTPLTSQQERLKIPTRHWCAGVADTTCACPSQFLNATLVQSGPNIEVSAGGSQYRTCTYERI